MWKTQLQKGKTEMKPATQSAIILAATLVIGFVVGVFATGALGNRRLARVERLRERGGFIEHMEHAIQPHDQTQRSAILPILLATAQRNRMIIDSARAELLTAFEEMIAELEPLLDEAQLRRVAETARFTDPFRPPPRPGDRGRGDRPPPGEPPPPPPG
jgi:hypothetical protein